MNPARPSLTRLLRGQRRLGGRFTRDGTLLRQAASLPEDGGGDPGDAAEPSRPLPATGAVEAPSAACETLRSRSATDAAMRARRPERRVELPIRRSRVTASIQAHASARGGNVSPETRARTSWFAFSDQFHRR